MNPQYRVIRHPHQEPAVAKSDTRQMTVFVPEKLFSKAVDLGTRAGMTPAKYAALMIEAAIATRLKPEAEPDLAQTVSGTLLLHGYGLDVDAIGRTLGVDEHVVSRIVNQWQSAPRWAQAENYARTSGSAGGRG